MREVRNPKMAKIVVVIAWLALVIPSAMQLYEHRHFKEPVVLGPGVTDVRKLSYYAPSLEGTASDCNIYVLDSGVPGATMLVAGGSHPEEPAGVLSAITIVENCTPSVGSILVCPRSSRSASTVTRPGDAYPAFFSIPTPYGERKFRMGDRWTNPLDSWPDPEVYIHYPSKQLLAYMDIRNLNRTWPGRSDGTLTERTCAALIELIEREDVDMFIDLHEAELEYSVISTIVAHQNAADVAAMASMTLSSEQFKMGMEYSPRTLHGLSHREVGDFTQALALEIEVPEPFIDRVRGITDEALLLTGKDEFVMKAGDHGLLYEEIDEKGWPIDERVGRLNSTIAMIVEMYNMMMPGKELAVENLPLRDDVVAKGVGYYLLNPASAPPDRVALD
jgi:hypothetical protein